MVLQYFGITELIGEINTGKSAICIEESKKYRSVYFCTTNFPIQRYNQPNEDVIIKLVQSIEDLLFYIKQCITFGELIIIDSLDSLLESNSHIKISRLVSYLKKIIVKYNLKVLIVNNTNSIFNKNGLYFCYKLGLEWEYQVNTKYHISIDGNTRRLKLVKCPIDISIEYSISITGNSVEYNKI